jgi:sensor domain CHASE-containing protein
VGGLWAGSFAVLRGGLGVELTSDPPADGLNVDLRRGLIATHQLIERARRHEPTKLTVTASVRGASGGRIFRTKVPLTVGSQRAGVRSVKVPKG